MRLSRLAILAVLWLLTATPCAAHDCGGFAKVQIRNHISAICGDDGREYFVMPRDRWEMMIDAKRHNEAWAECMERIGEKREAISWGDIWRFILGAFDG